MKLILHIMQLAFSLSLLHCSPNRRDGTKISNYEHYLEDLSQIGKEIKCTDEEKECYKLNRVLFTNGKCYSLGVIGPCLDSTFYFNKEKAMKGEYYAECIPGNKCESLNQKYMSFDGICYLDSLVDDVCDEKKNLSYATNIFGEGHCRCAEDNCFRPEVKQPDESGRCHLPDLMKTPFTYFHDTLWGRDIPCSADEYRCFEQGKMLHSDSKCYDILEQGPCANGELFTANKTEFEERGWLVSACDKPSCDIGSDVLTKKVRMQSDGKCHSLEDVQNRLCPPHKAVFDVFGEVGCGSDQDLDVTLQLPIIVPQQEVCRSRVGFI